MSEFFAAFFFFQAEDGIRDLVRSRGLGDVYKRQHWELLSGPAALGTVERLVGTETVPHWQLPYSDQGPQCSQPMRLHSTFSEFCALLTPHRPDQLHYLQWRRLGQTVEPSEGVEALMALLAPPRLIQGEELVESALWAGRCRSSSIHFDAMDNVHCVLQGQKTFYLWSPWQIEHLDMLPLQQRGDLRPIAAPTVYSVLGREHEQSLQPMQRVTVHAGSAVYIPKGWFHEVLTSAQDTVSCNYWFKAHPKARFRPTCMFLVSRDFLRFAKAKRGRKRAAPDQEHSLCRDAI
eukprot:TRINITY_DN23545_c0_g1_i1.p1 TRINITY_DN23545_c0_g1~~TRINITY_DN23545_c0_g1_i1.p1  ORF type:complete len:291 (+),score=70.76 TRINITY_DN23545_c0_g1_i1:3-875(+)